MLILNLIQVFCISTLLIGNPFILKIIYQNMESQYFKNRMQTTEFIWSLNTLPKIYNQREINHFFDVKILYQRFLWFTLTSLFFFRIPIITYQFFINFNIILMFVFIMLKYNFNTFWHYFHYPLFKNNSWLFSSHSKIIVLFPLSFWQNLCLFIFILFYFFFFLFFFIS